MKVVYGLPPRSRYGTFALDLEILRARKEQLHRPYGDFASLGISDGKTVWMIEEAAKVEAALQRIDRCRWVFHASSFDLRHLRRWAEVPYREPERFYDTLLVERLLWGGWYDRFGLKDLARRYLGVYLDKETRDEYSHAQELSPAMRVYAAKDPYYTYKIYERQLPLLEADPQSLHVWNEMDAPMLWATLDFQGIYLNQGRWLNLATLNEARKDEIAKDLGFNPGSPPQTRLALEQVGIRVESTGEDTLKRYLPHKLIEGILAYREAAARASRYGENILALLDPDGRLRCNFKATGAETGRTACDSPNLQNQPNEFDYRDCYIAPRGRRFITADYAKQEPCVMAELSRDPELLYALEHGENVHLYAGRLVFDNPDLQEYDQHGHKTKEYRIAKDLNLGLSYGMTAKGLAARTGLPLKECYRLVAVYFQRFKGIKQYIDRYRSLGRQDGYVRSLGGRRVWLNPYSYQCDNNAINAPMQSTGADMIKLATAKLHRYFRAGRYGKIFPIIGPIHDELLAECSAKQAKRVAADIRRCMTEAFQELCPNVKAKTIVDLHIGHSWAK